MSLSKPKATIGMIFNELIWISHIPHLSCTENPFMLLGIASISLMLMDEDFLLTVFHVCDDFNSILSYCSYDGWVFSIRYTYPIIYIL